MFVIILEFGKALALIYFPYLDQEYYIIFLHIASEHSISASPVLNNMNLFILKINKINIFFYFMIVALWA